MSEVLHAPLPWAVDLTTGEMVLDASGRVVVDCGVQPSVPRERARANAALIAAVGDLTTQLRGAVAMMRLAVSSLDIDPDRTVIEFRANGAEIARVSVATLLANAQAAIAKTEAR